MRTPNVFALAAKRMERGGIAYPCHAILAAKDKPHADYKDEPECARFMSAFSEADTPRRMSDEFCRSMNKEGLWHDNCVLALCFAAAMVDAGDL